MFLKRIEIHGFKSFADKSVITFDHNVTGIVGPNGCGKSNIAEAIRWVLGEQSVRSLRSNVMSDVIFNGSSNRKMVNLAAVTLVFDNTNRTLATDYDEVAITRKLHRNEAGGEYFINNVAVRLKDITDLLADSGIGKDSLSMISQGSMNYFAEAKPQERRVIFEEAAGVAKYKKRKNESLAKLSRTQENMERVQDIVYELEKQVNPLKRAAKKAIKYQEKKQRLETIEIAVLISLIDQLQEQKKAFETELFDIQTQVTLLETTINVEETTNANRKDQLYALDKEVTQLQEQLMSVVKEIQILETRKIEIDEKRKYALETDNAIDKSEQLSVMLQQAKAEYDDRLMRFEQSKKDIDDLNKSLVQLNRDYIDISSELDNQLNRLRRLNSRKEILENTINRPFIGNAGMSAVLNAKHSIAGVIDAVVNCFDITEKYEQAIATALGHAANHIVTIDQEGAKRAITFLKKNQSGRATFVPLSVLKKTSLNKEALIVCESIEGFLGVAADFVQEKLPDQLLTHAFLNNVIVVDQLDHATTLANLLHHQYKIVTLDGDVIHKGGTMSGGVSKDHHSLLTAKAELNEVVTAINQTQLLVADWEVKMEAVLSKKRQLDEQLISKRIAQAQLEPVLEAKRAKYERLKSELDQLSPDTIEAVGNFEDELISGLNHAYSKRDEITSSVQLKRETKIQTAIDTERKDKQLAQNRKQLYDIKTKEKNLEIQLAKIESNLSSYAQRLSTDYQMTIEYARTLAPLDDLETAKEEVSNLRAEIAAMGNINMDAPVEFEEVNTRYEFLVSQLDELTQARQQLLDVIKEMDEIMIERFSFMFDRINQELPAVFSALFGSGTAKLVLEQPDDLLNSGVDIDVSPKGKTIQNIRLFSGGEKSLIAISVLFAILKARHVPLCVFDEVDSALDQANVERFSRYLKQFSKQTQFVVITHRPGTMMQADVLYGVTMPDAGVSEMIRVQLVDAVAYSENGESEHGIS